MPFSCDVCGKLFGENSNLRKHALTHLKAEEQKKEHKCELCKFESNRSNNLKRHYNKVHEKY